MPYYSWNKSPLSFSHKLKNYFWREVHKNNTEECFAERRKLNILAPSLLKDKLRLSYLF